MTRGFRYLNEDDLPPTAAISAHIDRSMPKSVAGMVYSTDEVDAQNALSAGFVGHVVPAGDLYDRSTESVDDHVEEQNVS